MKQTASGPGQASPMTAGLASSTVVSFSGTPKEKVLVFGDDKAFPQGGKLVGILCEPGRGANPDRPAVIFLNAGVISRIGPGRMYVEFARDLASRGFSSLRLDLGGLGDSATREGQLAHIERAVADVRDASAALAERGFKRVVLVGLCSGALNAHAAAVALPEVCGAVLLDGYTYPTRGFYLRHYGPRLLDPRRSLGFVRRKAWALLSKLKTRLASTPLAPFADHLPDPPEPKGDSDETASYERDPREEELADAHFPDKEQVAQELALLLERRVQLLYTYSGGWNEYCNYEGQLEDTFGHLGFRGLVSVRRFPRADHTYTLLSDRRELGGALMSWIEERF